MFDPRGQSLAHPRRHRCQVDVKCRYDHRCISRPHQPRRLEEQLPEKRPSPSYCFTMGSCIKSLLLCAILILSVSAETEFCRTERCRCEDRCGGLGMSFRCDDKNGARSVACSCGSSGGTQRTSARSAVNVSLPSSLKLIIKSSLWDFASYSPHAW